MRNDSTAQSPRDRSCEVVVLTARQDGHPVHTTTRTLQTPPRRQEAELHGVYADVSRIAGRDVAMSPGGKFDEPIPDRHVRNRIKKIRFCTQSAGRNAVEPGVFDPPLPRRRIRGMHRLY
jgi:hypothetical protein